MRKLSSKQKQKAAGWIAISHSHLRAAEQLAKGKEYAAGLARLYYVAHFAARAAIVDSNLRSEKHGTWNGEFNKRFGRGNDWVPKIFAKSLNELGAIRELVDYEGAYPNEKQTYETYNGRVKRLLKKVIDNTPLCYYEDFISDMKEVEEILAVEFDYYCPKSYIHNERVQFQVMAEKYDRNTIKKLSAVGKNATAVLGAKREDDYVVGWNNRLGQSGDAYLLFLDIDEEDEGKVKAALQGTPGWLFKSGTGYHFIAKKLMSSRDAWQRKLETIHRSRKLKKLLDHKFMEFSIRRGYSTLRVDKAPIKDFKPFLFWESS